VNKMATGGILAQSELIESLWNVKTKEPTKINTGRLMENEFKEYTQALEEMKDSDGVKVNY
tara:strand:- start:7624 stop:7806 length:183 start_codon:yes stop_codon:yes gene_type:complete